MRISVVIPTHNRRDTLRRALQSIFAQTSPVDDVIVIDDGSDDASAAMVEAEFPDVRLIGQSNLGVSAARNRGIAAAHHPWIALLDSDDSWQPDKIEAIREAENNHPGFVLYHSDEIWIRHGRRVNPMQKHAKQGGWIFRHCLPLCAISPSASVISKSVLDELGGFDEALPACEDYDLWLRLCHRYPVHYIDRHLITKYGGHDDQLSRRYPAMDRFRVRALHRLLQQESLSEQDFEAARSMLLTKLDILIKGARKHDNTALLAEAEPLQDFWREQARAAAC